MTITIDTLWEAIQSDSSDSEDTPPILTPQMALSPSMLLQYSYDDDVPRLLQLSLEDWDRLINPPLRPQQPPKPLPREEEPFEVSTP